MHSGALELPDKTYLLSVVNDVSDQIELLREKNDLSTRLTHYLETSPTLTYAIRIHEGVDLWKWISDNVTRILGYSPADVYKTDWWFNNIHPVDRSRALSEIANLSGGDSISQEYRFLRKDRSFVWLSDVKRWSKALDGDFEIVGSLTDISERKSIEQEMRLKSLILEATINPILTTDTDGSIDWVNKAFESLVGYEMEEVIGKNPKDLICSGLQDDSFYQNLWHEIRQGKTWSGELVNRKKSGELFTVEMTITPLTDETGRIFRYFAVFSDITERKRAEENLQHARMLLKASIESPQDLIILCIDVHYRYLFFNEYHRTVMLKAYGTDIAVGMNILECITNDDDRLKAKRDYGRALAGENHITVEEYGELERVVYETRYTTVLNEQKEIIGASAFSSNITGAITV